MTDYRLKSIEASWALTHGGSGEHTRSTPPALVALEQVTELVAEVRRLQATLSEAQAVICGEFCGGPDWHSPNCVAAK